EFRRVLFRSFGLHAPDPMHHSGANTRRQLYTNGMACSCLDVSVSDRRHPDRLLLRLHCTTLYGSACALSLSRSISLFFVCGWYHISTFHIDTCALLL